MKNPIEPVFVDQEGLTKTLGVLAANQQIEMRPKVSHFYSVYIEGQLRGTLTVRPLRVDQETQRVLAVLVSLEPCWSSSSQTFVFINHDLLELLTAPNHLRRYGVLYFQYPEGLVYSLEVSGLRLWFSVGVKFDGLFFETFSLSVKEVTEKK